MAKLSVATAVIVGLLASAAQVGTATVRGRVVSADASAPLAGALITITVPGQRLPFTALTNDMGRYELTGLPPGRYPITASRPGYIRLAYGQTRPAQGGKPIVVAERQTIENVNFALPRGGVIAGVVVDEMGQPVIGAAIGALQRIYKNGKPSAAPVSFGNSISNLMLTNDLGEFRVYGLEPGIFYVGAMTMTTVAGMERPGAMIYAPGSANLADAQQVRVGLSQTVSGISIVLRSMKTATIAGIAVDRSQQPIAGSPLQLRQRGVEVDSGGIVRSARAEPDGRFIFTDVPPGDYTIGTVQRTPGVLRGASAEITLDGANLSDVRLDPLGTATVSGRVIGPSGAPRPPAGTRIVFDPVDPSLSSFGLFTDLTTIGADLAFSRNVFAVRMRIDVAQLPEGWTLKTVRRRGIDVTDGGIELAAGDEVRDVEVEITNRLTEITGTVRGVNGNPADDYTVIVFAKDPARRTGKPRYFATARPDQNGSFAIRGLAAGEYLAAALEYADVNLVEDPAFLNSLVTGATPLTLRDAAAASLDLKLLP